MDSELEEKTKELMSVRRIVLTSLISAFGFVLALFWNDAVRSAIEQIVPQGDTLAAKFAAAIIVTIIVVIIIYLLVHSQRIAEKKLQGLTAQKPVSKKILEIRRKRDESRRKTVEGSK